MDNNTTNKSDRNINTNFNELNKKFDEIEIKEKEREKELIKKIQMPHEKTIQENLLNIREIIYVLFDLIFNLKNPIPFIFNSPDNYFGISIIFIIIGLIFIILSFLFK